ncbi:MAG: TlpA family protein disulfide reductase [Dysgonamonadaceae bacterium]|jgi:thiol-disulfide isomerase/thioredoxin|nr:TlpA family protein disulfide reductase [Dysgonamonadaceae bacterium]
MKNKFRNTFACLLFLLILNPLYGQQKACIYSIDCDSTIKSVGLRQISPFWWSDYYADQLIRYEKDTSLQFHVEFELNQPEIKAVCLYPSGENWSATYHSMLVSPGDSIGFRAIPVSDSKTIEYRMEFTGKNAGHYNFMCELDLKFPHQKRPDFRQTGAIEIFKDSVDLWKKRKLDFLQSYPGNNQFSETFLKYINANIEDEYAFILYSPVANKLIDRDKLPADYFQDVYQLPLADESLTEHYYSSLLSRYISFYMDDARSNFDTIYQNIKQHTSGKPRAYLISALIGRFADHQGEHYKTELLNVIKESSEYVSDSIYLEYIGLAENYYLIHNKPFPEELLSSVKLKKYGDDTVISFKDLLNEYPNKAVYIDFWASWCAPCREDISKSSEAKSYLKEKDVAYVYISIDREEKNWRKATVEDAIAENQYLIEGEHNSALVKYLRFSSIPRYVLLDKDHKVKMSNAPRPIHYYFSQLKDEIQKITKRVVTFY